MGTLKHPMTASPGFRPSSKSFSNVAGLAIMEFPEFRSLKEAIRPETVEYHFPAKDSRFHPLRKSFEDLRMTRRLSLQAYWTIRLD